MQNRLKQEVQDRATAAYPDALLLQVVYMCSSDHPHQQSCPLHALCVVIADTNVVESYKDGNQNLFMNVRSGANHGKERSKEKFNELLLHSQGAVTIGNDSIE